MSSQGTKELYRERARQERRRVLREMEVKVLSQRTIVDSLEAKANTLLKRFSPRTRQAGERRKARRWTDEEQELFLESLELYGRNWKACSQHVRTRDPRAIASHAQRHFIKLYRHNLPLPAKVRESGEGYTLSGKHLDERSASYLKCGSQTTLKLAKIDKVQDVQLVAIHSENAIKEPSKEPEPVVFPEAGTDDPNEDSCFVCGDGGKLLCCDECPRAFHFKCIGLFMVPEGDWNCPHCTPLAE